MKLSYSVLFMDGILSKKSSSNYLLDFYKHTAIGVNSRNYDFSNNYDFFN